MVERLAQLKHNITITRRTVPNEKMSTLVSS